LKYLAITFFFFILLGLLSCSKGEHGISIKTDKKKYSQGERISISASNNSNLPVKFFCCGTNIYLGFHSWSNVENGENETIAALCPGFGRMGFECQIDENSVHDSWVETHRFKKGTYVLKYQLLAGGDTIYVNTNKFRIE
jgi:hypothetical protein